MEVELEVVGRHAMLFDDDATAAFVNSKDALIDWNSLSIDRFDVRNLLTNPPSSFRKLTVHGGGGGVSPDSHLEAELDLERYADLPSSSDELEIENEAVKTDASGYHFVPFSYGNSTDSSDQKNLNVAPDTSAFHPPFIVPESLLQNLPPTDKVHQIIARTASFVGENGGQSEIVLRVKQGDNPTFGFLMPHHHLHPYFRYLVDHPELLKADHDGKSQKENTNEDRTSGALSLLGSFYGTGEDEDVAAVPNQESNQVDSDETTAVAVMSKSHAVEKITGPESESGMDEIVSKVAHPSKVKVPSSSKNRSSSIKSVKANAVNKEAGTLASAGSIMDKSKTSSLFPVSEVETLLVDPPAEVKRLVDRIVEIILKNGRDFEAVLIEQDKKHGRFPFLVPSNQYHPYYLKVLKKAQESRLSGKSFNTETEKNTASRKDSHISSSMGCGADDSALDCDKKEKFKMVISKSKKDAHDHPSKETQQHSGITVDAAAAAAILQAATRGIKKPNLDIFSKTSLSGISLGSSNEGGQASSFGSHQSSQNQTSGQKLIENQKSNVTIPVAKEIANTAARAAAGEADSSEAGMTKEQKLKAERLRRAKMFAAMIKSGVAPLGTEPQEASSVKPSSSDFPGSATEVANREVKDREGSCVPEEAETSKRIEMPVRNFSDDEIERKARNSRHYRSRIHDDSEGEEDEYLGKSGNDEEYDDPRHSRKKHRSHNSSRHHRDRSKDTHKHRKKHSLSRNRESQHRHNHDSTSSPYEDDRHDRYKYDSSSDDEHKGHKRKHKHDSSSDDEHKRHKRKHKHDSSSDEDEHRHRKHKHDNSSDEDEHRHRKHKHDNSSDEDEHRHCKRKHKHYRKEEDTHKRKSRKRERKSLREEIELEEGEIRTKSSDQSSSAIGDDASTEASVDVSKISYQDKAPSLPPPETTEVPDELRAKIRAMLLATM